MRDWRIRTQLPPADEESGAVFGGTFTHLSANNRLAPPRLAMHGAIATSSCAACAIRRTDAVVPFPAGDPFVWHPRYSMLLRPAPPDVDSLRASLFVARPADDALSRQSRRVKTVRDDTGRLDLLQARALHRAIQMGDINGLPVALHRIGPNTRQQDAPGPASATVRPSIAPSGTRARMIQGSTLME